MLHRTILAALMAAAFARPSPALADTRLHYVAYTTGLRVLDLQADIAIGPASYTIETQLRTVGLIGALLDGDSHTLVRGVFEGFQAAPISFDSRGHWRGEQRQTTIDYVQGQPEIRALLPPNEKEREPVPPPLMAGTVDTLSAMAALVHQVSTSGQCDGSLRVFDGRRLSQITAHTAGLQVLQPTARSVFRGMSLRCDFDGRLLAGFRYADDRARAARPQQGSAWLAAATPGGPIVPVRIQFQTPFFGAATMYLAP